MTVIIAEDVSILVDMTEEDPKGTMFQVSILQALSLGDYEGHITVAQLKRHGDHGIGTFNGLDGEMIMLDGIVYRAAGDCSISEVSADLTVPFASVMFASDQCSERISVPSLQQFVTEMNAFLERECPNSIYMVRMHARFDRIKVRSVKRQEPPYKALVNVILKEQATCEREGISGTAVGFYCPSYMRAVNSPGWHLHFVSDDRSIGGHILDFSVSDGECLLSRAESFRMCIPDSERFQSLDLSEDQEENIRKIEGDGAKS